MLRITTVESFNHAVILRLEGRIVGPWVEELQKSCEEVMARKMPLTVHLAGVEFIDARGVALVSSLRSQGVAFVDGSPFVAEQLKPG